jgi:Na+-transporting methylmalonyl-CoA/oxaloacetate decarboxylase gamma subunit
LVGVTWAISVAVVVVTLGGFGMMFGLVMALINNGINLSGGGMVLIVFCLLIILAIASLLIRQLSRVLDLAQLTGATTQPQKPKLNIQPVQQIAAPREPVASVTEHTTRIFEPVRKEPDMQG